MRTIQILGTGCAKRGTPAANAERAVQEAGIEGEVVKVQDIAEILAFEGVRALPALAVDGEVKACGRVPNPGEIQGLLAENTVCTHREAIMSKTAIEEAVRAKYASVAVSGLSGQVDGVREVAEAFGYTPEELAAVPAGANCGLSCGNPTAFAGLKPGEVAVDLGSGGGLDVFLAAREVGPAGRAIGIDMTPEMVDLARKNAAQAKGPDGQPLTNVEFHLAAVDRMPLADASVDCVISNCVLNLVPDKPSAFREIARVLKPGGRLAVSDIALKRPLPGEIADDIMAYVGCIAGAILIAEYRRALLDAGFAHVEVIDSGSDLNVYAKIENQACCSPPAPSRGLAVVEGSSCCGTAPTANTPELLERMADLLRRFNVNDYAASVRVYAVKPR